MKPGTGKITVNGRDSPIYFARPVLRMLINQPFVIVNRLGQFDVNCTVVGGGLSGQAGAVRHGISKALLNYEPGLRPALKAQGFLTRDSRVVERKKYGRRKPDVASNSRSADLAGIGAFSIKGVLRDALSFCRLRLLTRGGVHGFEL